MAIFTSTIFSSIKNSIGGLTFYSGPNGNIVRVKNPVSNSKSISQKNSQIFFVNSKSGWNGLSNADRTSWNAWSVLNFSSLRNPSSSNKSGYLAYRSCQSACLNLDVYYVASTYKLLPSSAPIIPAVTSQGFNSPPVGYKVQSNIQDSPGISNPLIVLNETLTRSGLLQFDIQFGIIPHVQTVYPQFADINGNLYSFSLFISDLGNNFKFKPKNILSKCIWTSRKLSLPTPTLVGSSGIRINSDVSSNLLNAKFGLITGKWVYLTLVLTGGNGTQIQSSLNCIQIS
jgi:hypothetical protein